MCVIVTNAKIPSLCEPNNYLVSVAYYPLCSCVHKTACKPRFIILHYSSPQCVINKLMPYVCRYTCSSVSAAAQGSACSKLKINSSFIVINYYYY